MVRLNWAYSYYAFRTVFLATSLFFILLWVAYGFDSTDEQIFNPEWEGLGMHFSTYHALTFMAYVYLVNFQYGGLKSLKQLWLNIKLDCKAMFTKKYRDYPEYHTKKIRFERAIIASVCLALVPLFVFEVPYVFLLNYFHFGDLFFPVYMFETNFLSPVFWRNFSLLIIPFVLAIAVLKYKSRAKLKFRFDKKFLLCAYIMLFCWDIWVYYPSSHEPETPESLGLDLTQNWTMPNQKLFPQNTYIYMNVPLGTYYTRDNMDGWHQDEWQVHLINVVTKYMVFISVGYLTMFKIKNDEICD